MRAADRIALAFGVGLILVPLVYFCLSTFIDEYRLRHDARTVEALVEATEQDRVRYSFVLPSSGERYSHSDRTGRRNLWASFEPPGTTPRTVTVLYLEDNPWANRPKSRQGSYADSLVLLIFPLIVLAAMKIASLKDATDVIVRAGEGNDLKKEARQVEDPASQGTSWKFNASILTVLIVLSPLLAAALSQASVWINDSSTYGTELQKVVQKRTIGAFDPRPINKSTGEREGNNNIFFDQLAMNVSRPRLFPLIVFGLVYSLFGSALFGVLSATPLIGPRIGLIGLPGLYIVCLLIFGTYIGWWGAEGAN